MFNVENLKMTKSEIETYLFDQVKDKEYNSYGWAYEIARAFMTLLPEDIAENISWETAKYCKNQVNIKYKTITMLNVVVSKKMTRRGGGYSSWSYRSADWGYKSVETYMSDTQTLAELIDEAIESYKKNEQHKVDLKNQDMEIMKWVMSHFKLDRLWKARDMVEHAYKNYYSYDDELEAQLGIE